MISQWVWNLRLELGHQLQPQPLALQLGLGADHSNLPHQTFTLPVCDVLEFAQTERSELPGRPGCDQVKLGLIGALLVLSRLHRNRGNRRTLCQSHHGIP